MTDQSRADLHQTDEPDGTPAFEASLRPPGNSVTASGDDLTADAAPEDWVTQSAGPADADDDFGSDDAADHPGVTEVDRAGYDPEAVSGHTDAYRPE
jgi:hypothetical protein